LGISFGPFLFPFFESHVIRGVAALSPEQCSDRLLPTPFTTHEAVLAIAEALVADNPFEAAEIAISRKRFTGTYAMHDTSVEDCPVSIISITDYET